MKPAEIKFDENHVHHLRVIANGLAPILLLEVLAEIKKPVTIKRGEVGFPGSVTDEIGGIPVFLVYIENTDGLADYAVARDYITANL